MWAQDAVAEIELFRAKLKVISERIQRPPPTGPGQDQAICSVPTDAEPGRARRLRFPGVLYGRGRSAREADRLALREKWATAEAVDGLLHNAERAAGGVDPQYRLLRSWWSGNCTEAAFRNAHNAEATLALLYNDREVRAEVPEAARRARECLSFDDPMREIAQMYLKAGRVAGAVTPTDLSVLIEAGHAAADRQRSRLRTFRNILIVGGIVSALLLAGLVILGALGPDLVPLCFMQDFSPADEAPNISCPVESLRSESLTRLPTTRFDFFIVAILGLTGGALSAALFIRDLYSNATPYNVSVPLALLKLPAGALTALVGIILLAGEFVPGFSAVDKPIQILAYALLFGFAQQLFTQFLDQRAQNLVNNVPTKARGISNPGMDRSAANANTLP